MKTKHMLKHRTIVYSLFIIITLILTPMGNVGYAEDQMDVPFKDTIYTNIHDSIITKGVVHQKFDVFDKDGWLRGDILTIDLKDENIHTDLLHTPKLTQGKTPSQLAREAGAIAAVNGDFFDIHFGTRAPQGYVIKDGQIVKTSQTKPFAIGVNKDNLGNMLNFALNARIIDVSRPNLMPIPLNGINEYILNPGQTMIYTSVWGKASRNRLVKGSSLFAEIVVKNNVVVDILKNNLFKGNIPDDTYILLGRDNGAKRLLDNIKKGDILKVDYRTNIPLDNISYALSGDEWLVQNGKPNSFPSSTGQARHPRTAVGFNKEGNRMYLVVVDGRQKDSRGMSYDEIAQFMTRLGAFTALNFDSGGSSQMVARPEGKEDIEVINSPSDGRERAVPNGIGIFTKSTPGNLTGFNIETPDKNVLLGLTRTFKAHPYDENHNPINIDKEIIWSVSNDLGIFEKPGLFKATNSGKGEVNASLDDKSTPSSIRVLGKPVNIYPSTPSINFNTEKTGTFEIYGRDANGYSTIIEPRDIKIEYDANLIDIKPQGNSFVVNKRAGDGNGLIEISVSDLKTYVGYSMGLKQEVVEKFEDPSKWKFTRYPNTVGGQLSFIDSPNRSGKALRLDYDFTKTKVTRAAYAMYNPGPLKLPQGTKKIGMWAFGDGGNGHWLRGVAKDGSGKNHNIDFANKVDWKGWKYVEADLSKLSQPISLERVYIVATNPESLNSGYIILDDLTASIPRVIELPEEEEKKHSIVIDKDNMPEGGVKFLIVDNLDLDPSLEKSQALEYIEQRLNDKDKLKPELVIFTGRLCKLEEGMSYTHECIKEVLGDTKYHLSDSEAFNYQGTMFISLDMKTGSWRTTDATQWKMVQNALNAAKDNKEIKNVVVINEMYDNITDDKEYKLMQKTLTKFMEKSNRPAVFINTDKRFDIDIKDGIRYIKAGDNTPVFIIDNTSDEWLKIIR
ncbi:phosphodiester glycosidase family protein [Xylanivirga thermophila]|uniref:phosphodiester glycosidase family protein n=1 Tax=Xylanivirga thermophila TaxID=2496273 RepID=UPI00101B82D1|nr:phosphodiester glycosidase family protein [Xylanivirga thermophila]